MSDTVLQLIPADPTFVPAAAAQQAAARLLSNFLPGSTEISATDYDEVVFVDQGELFETILCPACGSPLAIRWWQAAMDDASQSHFNDLLVTTPCCGATTSLNDLQYEQPAGFARFVLEVLNPRHDLATEQITAVSHILGSRLRKIWARY